MSAEQVVRPPSILVAAGTSVRPGEKPVHPRRVFTQVIAGALVVLSAVALAGVVASRRLAEAEAVNDAAKTANLLADAVVQPAVSDALLTGDSAAGVLRLWPADVPSKATDRSVFRLWPANVPSRQVGCGSVSR